MNHLAEGKNNEYIHTTSVHTWLILCAVFVLLAVFILWMFTGNMLELENIKVFCTEDGVYGYISVRSGEPAKLREDMEVVFDDGGTGFVKSIDQYVYTQEEMQEMLGGSLANQIAVSDLGILITIETAADFDVSTVRNGWVVLDEVRPFKLWFAGGE